MSKNVVIEVALKNKYGLHARPAALFVQMCNRFSSGVTVYYNSMKVSGKNILDIMTLGAEPGTVLKIEFAGPDAAEAAEGIKGLIEGNFGEA